jgi:phage baseplate assembly protein W
MAIPINKSTSILDRNKDKKIGIVLPFRNSEDGYFDSSKLTLDAVKENIRNLIQTRKGERLFQPDLGMGLEQFLFENITEDLKITIEDDIRNTIKFWLPFVIINNLVINENENSTGLSNSIKINLDFSMTYSSNMTDSIEIVIS